MSPTLEAISASTGSATAADELIPTNSSIAVDHSAAMRLAVLIGLILCTLAMWCLVHPYGGIIQDAVFYLLAASERLHPSLAHEIFLGDGSQDHYTIFSPIVAAVIRLVGIGRAAAFVTAFGQAALCCATVLFVRRIIPWRLAFLSVALFLMLPSFYGSHHIFAYTEDFMTSRVPSEALVLASLIAALDRRYVLAAICTVGGMLLHPLTALAGVVMLYFLVLQPRPGPTVALGCASLGALSLVAWWMPFWRISRIDPVWLDLLHWRMRYGFPTLWSLSDWGRTSVPLATLVVGAMGNIPSLARRVCLAAIATGLASIIVSILGSDLLHVLVITQIQPWRWLWLANAVAVLLLPVIAADRWRGGDADRACFLLIVASWLSYEQTFTLIVSALALTAASIRNRSLDPRQVRRLFIGSVVVLAIVALVVAGWVANIVLKQLALPASATLHPSAFGLFSYRLIPYTADGILPVGVFTLIWWFAMHRSERRAGPVVLLVGCVLLGITAPAAWGTWSDPAPSREYRAKFAAWRQQIPETAQVLAPGVPLIPWFLLDRASYWSVRQMAGIAFSRPTAMEFFRRMAILSGMPPARTGAEALKHMCTSDPLIEFVVSRADLGPTRFAPIASDSAGGSTWLYLYRCADQRSQSGAGTSQAPQTQE